MERYQPFFEVYDDAIEKQIEQKGYAWGKGKSKSFMTHNPDKYKLDKSGDIDYEVYPSKIVKTKNDSILKVDNFFICFFGDHNYQDYEFGAISTSESELYELLRNRDEQECVLGKYDKKKASVKFFTIYPFEDGR